MAPPPKKKTMLRRRAGGRPKALFRRWVRVRLYLTENEHRHLIARAELAGVPLGVLARSLSLYGTIQVAPVPRVNYAAVLQLIRVGVLLNQALRKLHSGEIPPELGTAIADALTVLTGLRKVLVTAPRDLP
jgi:hypothetical protein